MSASAIASGLLALALVACDARSMRNQARMRPYRATPFFADGSSARPPVEGTVPAGDLADMRARRAGAPTERPTPTALDRLERGRQRFDIACAPCHGRDGYGQGMVVRRGFPAPPSFHSERLRDAGDQHIVDVITHGLGKMPPYGSLVSPDDRWAIARYVRALQRSQHASLTDVPPAERAGLHEEGTP